MIGSDACGVCMGAAWVRRGWSGDLVHGSICKRAEESWEPDTSHFSVFLVCTSGGTDVQWEYCMVRINPRVISHIVDRCETKYSPPRSQG